MSPAFAHLPSEHAWCLAQRSTARRLQCWGGDRRAGCCRVCTECRYKKFDSVKGRFSNPHTEPSQVNLLMRVTTHVAWALRMLRRRVALEHFSSLFEQCNGRWPHMQPPALPAATRSWHSRQHAARALLCSSLCLLSMPSHVHRWHLPASSCWPPSHCVAWHVSTPPPLQGLYVLGSVLPVWLVTVR